MLKQDGSVAVEFANINSRTLGSAELHSDVALEHPDTTESYLALRYVATESHPIQCYYKRLTVSLPRYNRQMRSLLTTGAFGLHREYPATGQRGSFAVPLPAAVPGRTV
jgi:hypothetical protein